MHGRDKRTRFERSRHIRRFTELGTTASVSLVFILSYMGGVDLPPLILLEKMDLQKLYGWIYWIITPQVEASISHPLQRGRSILSVLVPPTQLTITLIFSAMQIHDRQFILVWQLVWFAIHKKSYFLDQCGFPAIVGSLQYPPNCTKMSDPWQFYPMDKHGQGILVTVSSKTSQIKEYTGTYIDDNRTKAHDTDIRLLQSTSISCREINHA